MFTKKVTDDDRFTALSASAQALYLHLSMNADDDGFCNQLSTAMFKAHASVQDLEALLERRYIYEFDDGVIVIKHWRMANALRKDRYTMTAFKEDLAKLRLDENGAYTMSHEDMVANWLPDGCQVVATGKDRIDKDSLGKDNDVGDAHKGGEKKTDAFVVYAGSDKKMLQALKDFEEMRKKIKKPLTDKAKELLINKLKDYPIEEQIPVIEQSVERAWAGIYDLKKESKKAEEKVTAPKTYEYLTRGQLKAMKERK